jgi:microcystin-dependent protein
MKKFLAFIAVLGTIAVIAYGQNQKASDQGATTGTVIPAGTVMAFAGSTAPSGWVLSYGQELSQTTYAKLFAAIGSTYCTADHGGGCTGGFFRVPDLRGRTLAGKDNMGGTAANRLTSAVSLDGTVLGKAGGSQNRTIASSNLPTHTHGSGSYATSLSGTFGSSGHKHQTPVGESGGFVSIYPWYGTSGTTGTTGIHAIQTGTGNTNILLTNTPDSTASLSGSNSVTGSSSDGGFANTAIQTVQPVNIINYIIKL